MKFDKQKMGYYLSKFHFLFFSILIILISIDEAYGQATCVGATAVSVTVNGTCPGGSSDATLGTFTTNNCGVPNRESWFRFNATASTATIVGTMTSGAAASELLIEVYSSCAVGSVISCTNANTAIQTAQTETLVLTGLAFPAVYFVRLVNTFGNNSSTSLCIKSPQPNDEPSGAVLLTVPGGSVCTNLAPAPTLVSATTSTCAAPGCANFAGTAVDLWYKVVVPASGNLFLKMTTLNAGIATYSGTPGAGNDCGTLSLLACSGGNPVGIVATSPAAALVPTLYTSATPGSTVYVRVWNENGITLGTFNICATDLGPCGNNNNTPNDWCSNAGAIMTSGTPGVGTHTISSAYTADSPGNIAQTPVITCGGVNNNMWFSFISDGSALNIPIAVTTSTCASLYAQVYSVTKTPAGCCKDFTPISSNAPTCTSSTYSFNPATGGNIVTPALTAGQQYYLMISNKTNNQTCAFTLTGWAVAGILAVDFVSFIGNNKGKFNELEWISASEQNVISYVLEHSEDGINFSEVQTIVLKANNSANNKYTVNDENPFEDDTYYRIKQNMMDGGKEYSHTISVSLRSKYDNIYNIQPNPTTDNLNFEYYSKANNSINIELLNYAGASVLKLYQPLEEGKNNITLPMSELDNGVYILKVVSEKSGKTTHHKIIKN